MKQSTTFLAIAVLTVYCVVMAVYANIPVDNQIALMFAGLILLVLTVLAKPGVWFK